MKRLSTIINEAKRKLAKGGQLYLLVGIEDNLSQDRIGGAFVKHPSETEIALFSSHVAAKKFVKKNSLAKPDRRFGGETFPFRKTSMLGPYNSVEIREYQKPLPLPLDPQ